MVIYKILHVLFTHGKYALIYSKLSITFISSIADEI